MSLAELQKEAATLSLEERRKLAAYLVTLHQRESPEWEASIQGDDDPHAGYISWEEASERLARKA